MAVARVNGSKSDRPFRQGRSSTPPEAMRRDREVIGQRTPQVTASDSRVYMIASGQLAHLEMVESERWTAAGYSMIGAYFAAFGLLCTALAVRAIVAARRRAADGGDSGSEPHTGLRPPS